MEIISRSLTQLPLLSYGCITSPHQHPVAPRNAGRVNQGDPNETHPASGGRRTRHCRNDRYGWARVGRYVHGFRQCPEEPARTVRRSTSPARSLRSSCTAIAGPTSLAPSKDPNPGVLHQFDYFRQNLREPVKDVQRQHQKFRQWHPRPAQHRTRRDEVVLFRGRRREMHDVLTVTSQGSDGGHTRKTTPASRSSTSTTDERKHTPDEESTYRRHRRTDRDTGRQRRARRWLVMKATAAAIGAWLLRGSLTRDGSANAEDRGPEARGAGRHGRASHRGGGSR